jgi:hypothetical protein
MTAAAGGLAVGMLGFAAPAGASSGVAAAAADSLTVNGSSSLTIRTVRAIDVAATAQATCSTLILPPDRKITISLAGPTGPNPATGMITSSNSACSQPVTLHPKLGTPRRNGAYTLTLRNGAATRTTSATIDVLVPPARTADVKVSAVGTIATFSWKAGSDPDVTSYQVLDSAGAVKATADAVEACHHGTHCSTKVDLGHSAAGRVEKFSIRTVRCGLSCSAGVDGPRSASVTAHFAGETTSPPTSPPTQPATVPSSTTPTAPAASSPSAGSATHSSHPHHATTTSAPPTSAPTSTPPTSIPTQATTPTTGVSITPQGSIGAAGSGGGSARPVWRGIAIAVVVLLAITQVVARVRRPKT